MLKNIEKMRSLGIPIKKDWLVLELYSYGIPPAILKGLALKCPNEIKPSTRDKSQNHLIDNNSK